jgi:hypothetical protein
LLNICYALNNYICEYSCFYVCASNYSLHCSRCTVGVESIVLKSVNLCIEEEEEEEDTLYTILWAHEGHEYKVKGAEECDNQNLIYMEFKCIFIMHFRLPCSVDFNIRTYYLPFIDDSSIWDLNIQYEKNKCIIGLVLMTYLYI